MDSKKPVHAFDLNTALIYDKKSSHYLTNEFFYRGYDKDIILKTEEENNESGSKKILKLACYLEM